MRPKSICYCLYICAFILNRNKVQRSRKPSTCDRSLFKLSHCESCQSLQSPSSCFTHRHHSMTSTGLHPRLREIRFLSFKAKKQRRHTLERAFKAQMIHRIMSKQHEDVSSHRSARRFVFCCERSHHHIIYCEAPRHTTRRPHNTHKATDDTHTHTQLTLQRQEKVN